MEKVTIQNYPNYFLLPSQHGLLGMMSEFLQQRDDGLLNNTITVNDIRNGEQQFLDLVVIGAVDDNVLVHDYYILTSDQNEEKILLRLYSPQKKGNEFTTDNSTRKIDSLTPCLIYIHGGGGVQLSVQFYDYVLRYIAHSSGLTVAAMNYRLAPENPFPKGLDDVINSIKWIADNGKKLGIDKDRLALGGDSAGATMALSAALKLREKNKESSTYIAKQEEKHLLRALYLIYGHYSPNVMETESMQIFGVKEWSFTTKTFLGWYLKNLHQDKEDYNNKYAFPLLADNLKGLPSTYIVTTATDTYRDDNIALAKKFEQEKQEYYLTMWPGVMHASINLLYVTPEVQKYIDSMTAFLKGILLS